MVPLYILGLLLRFGPQHGYQIKKLLEEQLSDFTQIKLPTVYYHLDKMAAAGLVLAHTDRQGARPEKTVYEAAPAGAKQFEALLRKTLNTTYRPTFDIDASLYFADALPPHELLSAFDEAESWLCRTLQLIEQHKAETLACMPAQAAVSAELIFDHHLLHYQAELDWVRKAASRIKEAAPHDKNESD